MSATTDNQTETEKSRGRAATDPTQLPVRGWKDVAWRLYQSVNEDRIMLIAAGVTYYMVLALVPALTTIISIYGLFNDASGVVDQLEKLRGIAPPNVIELLRDQLSRLTAESDTTLGWTLLISSALTLWSASAGAKALFQAMNVAYAETEKRNFFQLNALALGFTLGGALSIVAMLTVVVGVPAFLQAFSLGSRFEWTIQIVSYLAIVVVVAVITAALYRFGPSRADARWQWVSPGVILAVVAVLGTSALFSWYVANFSNYNATYGSLGAIIGLLTWIWLSTTLLILGAELNSELEHQTSRDTTTGSPRPMGKRGAYVADHMGAPWSEDDDRAQYRPQKPERISWGTLALVAPAALLLHQMQQRQDRTSD